MKTGKTDRTGQAPEKKGRVDVDAARRQVLALGTAAVPTVLTLRASASQALVSQLTCLFRMPAGYVFLVDAAGAVWMADLGWSSAPNKVKQSHVDEIKSSASFIFPAGTAPQNRRPKGCDDDDDDWGDDDDDDGGWGDDDDDDGWWDDDEDDLRPVMNAFQDQNSRHYWWWDDDDDGGDDDDDDDDDGGNGNKDVSCNYKIIVNKRDIEFPISRRVDAQGNWKLNGKRGFYILLATRYAEVYGNSGNFPGISCIVSVLNYFDQQGG